MKTKNGNTKEGNMPEEKKDSLLNYDDLISGLPIASSSIWDLEDMKNYMSQADIEADDNYIEAKEKDGGKQLESLQREAIQFVLGSLEKGKVPWRLRPRDDSSPVYKPCDAISYKAYCGTTLLFLLMAQQHIGYTDPRWLTFKQASEKGWRVKDGAKGIPIFFWNCCDKATNQVMTGSLINDLRAQGLSDDEIRERRKLVQRYLRVFNAEQIDGIPELESEE